MLCLEQFIPAGLRSKSLLSSIIRHICIWHVSTPCYRPIPPQTFRKLVADQISQRTMLDEHRRAFQLFDVLGQGAIDFATLKRAVRSLGMDIPDEELQV